MLGILPWWTELRGAEEEMVGLKLGKGHAVPLLTFGCVEAQRHFNPRGKVPSMRLTEESQSVNPLFCHSAEAHAASRTEAA